MFKNFRFLLYCTAPNYGIALVFAAGIAAVCGITGSNGSLGTLFAGYFNMFPAILLLTALLTGVAYTTSTLNHVLSYGGRRADYFRGLQLLIVCNTLVFWAIEVGFAYIPVLLEWENLAAFYPPELSAVFPLLMLAASSLGCAVGEFYAKSRWVAALMSGITAGLLVFGSTALTFMRPGLWGDLHLVICVVCMVITLVCTLRVRRVIQKAAVR